MAEGELSPGRCGPDCRLSQRASAGARPPVCRQGPHQISVDPSSVPLLSLPLLEDPEIADPSDCPPPPPSLLSSRGKNERGPCGTFSLAFLQVRPRSPLVSLSVVRPRSQQVVRTRGPPVKRNRSRLPRASRICFF